MKKFLLAPLLAAVAMFVFGAIYWISPFPYQALQPVADSAATADALAKLFPATGTYLIPDPGVKDEKLLTELSLRGPSAQVQFIKEGHPPIDPGVFLKGFLHYFVVAFLLAFFLSKLPTSQGIGYTCIVQICAFIGAIGAIFICFNDPIWWHHPWGWKAMEALYVVLNSAIAGLVLGRFFRVPAPAKAS